MATVPTSVPVQGKIPIHDLLAYIADSLQDIAAGGGGGGSGDVSGPVTSTDNAVPRWDGTGGDTLQDSGVLIADNGVVTVPGAQVIAAGAMTSHAIDVTKGDQTDSITANTTLTLSATPAAQTVFGFRLTADSSGPYTITLPAGTWYSEATGGNRTTFTIGASQTVFIQVKYDGSRYLLFGDPVEVVQHFAIAFDPKAVCDGAVDRLFLMTVSALAFPHGIQIQRWSLSFEADPTTEADIDLKRADAFIGVANAAVMDVADTTAGVSSETTPGNINSGATIATTKVIYLEFGTAYSEANHQCIFEMDYTVKQ